MIFCIPLLELYDFSFAFRSEKGGRKEKVYRGWRCRWGGNVLRTGSYFQFEQMRKEELSEDFWTTFTLATCAHPYLKVKGGGKKG